MENDYIVDNFLNENTKKRYIYRHLVRVNRLGGEQVKYWADKIDYSDNGVFLTIYRKNKDPKKVFIAFSSIAEIVENIAIAIDEK